MIRNTAPLITPCASGLEGRAEGQPCSGRPRGAAPGSSATHTGRLEVLLRSSPKSRAARKWSLKAGISVSVAAKPSSDPPRLSRRGKAGQAAMAAAGAAPAKGVGRDRAGALPTAFPAGRYAGGAGCAGPLRPIGGGGDIFDPGTSFLPAWSSARTTSVMVSGFGRAEGVWTRLSLVSRSAVLLRNCAESSACLWTAPPRTPPRNARNRHGRLGPLPLFTCTSLPCGERGGGGAPVGGGRWGPTAPPSSGRNRLWTRAGERRLRAAAGEPRPAGRGVRLPACRMRESGERSGRRVRVSTYFFRCRENSVKYLTGDF